MAGSTFPLFDRIALVFDFDETLAEDCLASFLAENGSSMAAFDERVTPMTHEGWAPMLARMWTLIRMSRAGELGGPVTRARLAEHGRAIRTYPGVDALFDRVRQRLADYGCKAVVEFHVVSAGLGDIIAHAPVAEKLDSVNASQFCFDDDDAIAFPKRTISHVEKTRYLLQIALGIHGSGEAVDLVPDLHSPLSDDRTAVPFAQMIYVGDGHSDLPCFSLINNHRGVSLGVAPSGEPKSWSQDGKVGAGRRVENVAAADFTEGSELYRSLMLGVERIAARIELHRLSRGE